MSYLYFQEKSLGYFRLCIPFWFSSHLSRSNIVYISFTWVILKLSVSDYISRKAWTMKNDWLFSQQEKLQIKYKKITISIHRSSNNQDLTYFASWDIGKWAFYIFMEAWISVTLNVSLEDLTIFNLQIFLCWELRFLAISFWINALGALAKFKKYI